MDTTNPNAPSTSLSLAPVQNTISSLVKQDFPVDVLHRHAIAVDLSTGPLSIAETLNALTGFAQSVMDISMYIEIESVEVSLDSFASGTVVAVALTHDAEAPGSLPSILSQRNHFSHRTTDLTSGTITHSLPFYNGMTKQLKPTPINGFYPSLLVNVNQKGVGILTIALNYRRGGPMITRSDWSILTPRPLPFVEAAGPLEEGLIRIEVSNPSELMFWFKDELGVAGLGLSDVADFQLQQADDGGKGFQIWSFFSPAFKAFSEGFVPALCGRDDALNCWIFPIGDDVATTLAKSTLDRVTKIIGKRRQARPGTSASAKTRVG